MSICAEEPDHTQGSRTSNGCSIPCNLSLRGWYSYRALIALRLSPSGRMMQRKMHMVSRSLMQTYLQQHTHPYNSCTFRRQPSLFRSHMTPTITPPQSRPLSLLSVSWSVFLSTSGVCARVEDIFANSAMSPSAPDNNSVHNHFGV